MQSGTNSHTKKIFNIDVEAIDRASQSISPYVDVTPLIENLSLSTKFGASIFLKREDLQIVRSYKIRGALYKILSLTEEEMAHGIVCASAGNHAQGVAYAAKLRGVKARIYMPSVTPQQKIQRVKLFGQEFVQVKIYGDTFDEASKKAMQDVERNGGTFIHPFDDMEIMAGQGTVGKELVDQFEGVPDIVILPIGGGGLASGVGTYLKAHFPKCRIIGVEPAGAPAMQKSIFAGMPVKLEQIDLFVDGAAVQQVGSKTFDICRKLIDKVVTVEEGHICTTILQLYNEEAIVAEPAGVLAISALDVLAEEIKGKKVICLLSGGNNDILRMEEIKERSLLHQGLKHYFVIRFPQRSGALRDFLDALGPDDDITHFEYTKKHNRTQGPALVGIELKRQEDYDSLIERMEAMDFSYQTVNDDPVLFEMLV